MYEKYTRQALPSKYYRELLGSAICVFNSNNAFVIENILKLDDSTSWYQLIDKESGRLKNNIKDTITKYSEDDTIQELFEIIVLMRNRIIHSFQITNQNGEQVLATKAKEKDGGAQFVITEEYLVEFIGLNEKLSDKLYKLRDSIESA